MLSAGGAARLIYRLHSTLSALASPSKPLKYDLDNDGAPVFNVGTLTVHVLFQDDKNPIDMVVLDSPAGHDEFSVSYEALGQAALSAAIEYHHRGDLESLKAMRQRRRVYEEAALYELSE